MGAAYSRRSTEEVANQDLPLAHGLAGGGPTTRWMHCAADLLNPVLEDSSHEAKSAVEASTPEMVTINGKRPSATEDTLDVAFVMERVTGIDPTSKAWELHDMARTEPLSSSFD